MPRPGLVECMELDCWKAWWRRGPAQLTPGIASTAEPPTPSPLRPCRRNEVDTIAQYLAEAKQMVGALSLANSTVGTLQMKQLMAKTLSIFPLLSQRSIAVFTLTPDYHCKEFYR